jgi:hypothetical protein
MAAPGQHAARPVTPRSVVATVLTVLVVLALGVSVALPAYQAYATKQQGQELAGKVLAVCGQGGDAAAPLVAIHACPLAQDLRATAQVAASAPVSGVTPAEIQAMIKEEVARQLPRAVAPAVPIEGGVTPRPTGVPGVAGLPGDGSSPGPAELPPNEQIQSTATERAPQLRDRQPPIQYGYPASRREGARHPPERTVTEQPPAPVTVTEQAPPTVTQTAPAPVTRDVNQPEQAAQPAPQPAAPADQGVPLLDGVGGLLNGLGNGL